MSSPTTIHHDMVELWNRRNFSALGELLHSEYARTGGDGKEITGPEAGLRNSRMWAEAFPDGTLEIRHLYTQGNTAIAEMVGRGTHNGNLFGFAPTGRPVEVIICNVIEVRDGKIHREREYLDVMTIMTQIGAMPAPGKAAKA
jgi:predicted ester cyclase